MSTAGNLSEEPQEARGAPGSRDAGSDRPAGGPTDRPSEGYKGDETVPSYQGQSETTSGPATGTLPPQDVKPAVPPYEGRQTSSATGTTADDAGEARTAGASGPTTDTSYKSSAPGETAGGATTSPGDTQPASEAPETNRDDDMTGPGHEAGTGRGEQKL